MRWITIKKKLKQLITSIRSFTLVELSIVMVIVGLVAGTAFQVVNRRNEAEKINSTNATMDKLEEAFAQFVAVNKRLPCPADATQNTLQANFGVATRDTTNDEQCDGTAGLSNAGFPNLVFGSVPTKTLWIDDKLAFDAWKRPILYAMIQHCNANPAEHINDNFATDSCGQTATSGRISIRSASGSTITDNAVMVLISFGQNGHGAFPRGGGTVRTIATTAPGTDELNNSMLTGTGTLGTVDNIFVQKSKTLSPDYFDDIVRFKTRYQLIRDAGMNSDQTSAMCELLDNAFPNLSEDMIDIPNLSTATGRTACDADAAYCLPRRQEASAICGTTTDPLCPYYMLHVAHYLKQACFDLQ